MTGSHSGGDGDAVPGFVPLGETSSIGDELWRFTVGLFKSDGVEACCLEWQRHYDVDISFLLWAGWLQHLRGVILTAEAIAGALEAVAEWRRKVIAPVRDTRLFLKSSGLSVSEPALYTDLRSHLRAVELSAERREQHVLIGYASTILREHIGNGGGASNMARYLRLLSGSSFGHEQERLERIDQLAADIARTARQ